MDGLFGQSMDQSIDGCIFNLLISTSGGGGGGGGGGGNLRVILVRVCGPVLFLNLPKS